MNSNLKAFLDTISVSEGTSTIKASDNGYNVLVGGKLFTSYATHPNKRVKLSPVLTSTAAGRYQLLHRYFVAYSKLLKLKDFSPASQDAIAIQQIRERKALPDIEAGKFESAVKKCSNIWASFPGAGYGQHEHKIEHLKSVFVKFGGKIAP